MKVLCLGEDESGPVAFYVPRGLEGRDMGVEWRVLVWFGLGLVHEVYIPPFVDVC